MYEPMGIIHYHRYPFSISKYQGEEWESIVTIKNDVTGIEMTCYSDMGNKKRDGVRHSYWHTDGKNYLFKYGYIAIDSKL